MAEPIAVVGYSFRVPGQVASARDFWELIRAGRSSTPRWPKERLNSDAYHNLDAKERNTITSCGAHFLDDDVYSFDAQFFTITAAEAAKMDPQQRILLETTYTACENAGISLDTLRGSKTGVFAGAMTDDFRLITVRDIEDIQEYATQGSSSSLLANRISWFFDLKGPSITLDTACSSSLTSLHLACQSLLLGESNLAISTGVNLMLGIENHVLLSRLGVLAPDGYCKSFDERANGYARGEGAVVLVLKRLQDAIADNDPIRGIVRATGINQDGHTPGIVVPSMQSQAQLISDTYARAGLGLESTRYVEAHGTGTAVGDPIEAEAISHVFHKCRSSADPLYVGSVKANIGHLEGASGAVGVLKALLALEHGVIPPVANIRVVNPKIRQITESLEFPTKALPWPAEPVRRASVSSFGMGGSNGHVILDDVHGYLSSKISPLMNYLPFPAGHCGNHLGARSATSQTPGCGCTTNRTPSGAITRRDTVTGEQQYVEDTSKNVSRNLLICSAADKATAQRTTAALSTYVDGSTRSCHHPSTDLAFTLSNRRSHFPWRTFSILETTGSHAKLQKTIQEPVRVQKGNKAQIAFVFTGQGAQYLGMGTALLEYPVFTHTLALFDEVLSQLGCEWNIFDILHGKDAIKDINSPEYSQPLCTALQVALVELLRTFGIYPSVVIGHSSGEISAAYTIGAISLASAARVAFYRGKLAASLIERGNSGSMMAVAMSKESITPYLEDVNRLDCFEEHETTIAAINSPQNVTISGTKTALQSLKSRLDSEGIFCREIHTGVGYHSHFMFDIAERYRKAIQDLDAGQAPPTPVRMISTVTGDIQFGIERLRDADYWVQNMIQPVKFSDAMMRLADFQASKQVQEIIGQGVISDVIEIGPHPALKRYVEESLVNTQEEIRYNSTLSRFDQTPTPILELVGHLYCRGYAVNVEEANVTGSNQPRKPRCLTDLPEYPFNRQRFWHESKLSEGLRFRKFLPHPLLGAPVSDFNPLEAKWRNTLSLKQLPWLADHKVNGRALLPAAGMVAIAVEAASRLAQHSSPVSSYYIKDINFTFSIAVGLEDGDLTHIETYVRPLSTSRASGNETSSFEVKIYVESDKNRKEASCANVKVESKGSLNNEDILKMQSLQQNIAHVRGLCSSTVHAEDVYHLFADMGLEYGGAFKGLNTVYWDKGHSAAAHIQSSQSAHDTERNAFVDYIINPAILDALAQLAIVPLTSGGSKVSPTCLPTRFRGLWISAHGLNGNSADGLTSSMTSSWKGSTGTDATGIAQDQNGDIVCSIQHLEATLVSNSASEKGDDGPRRLCYEPHLRPDIDMLNNHQLQSLVQPEPVEDPRTIDFNIRVRHAMKWFISTMLAQITEDDVKNAKPHIQRYIDWLTRTRISTTHEECWNIEDDAFLSAQLQDAVERENFFTTLQHDNPIGELYMSVGRNILPIIRGDSNVLELLFNSRLADDYYIESMKAHERSLPQILGSYIDLLAHKNPSLSVLEIGAGTGAVTNPALSALQANAGHQGIPRYSVYDFTDISPAFFERAKARLPPELQSDRIRFRTLDIEQNPSDQGFDNASYDLIIAGYVLHATKDLKATLRNVRQLLKPGGRLVLCELVKNDPLGAPFAFGLLPGWWLATDARDSGACVDEDAWARLLSDNGFSGADVVFKDTDKSWLHQSSVIFATAVEQSRQDSPTKPDPSITVVGDPTSIVQADIACGVGVGLSVISLEESGYTDRQRSRLTIFLFELERPLLADMDEAQFEQLKTTLLSSKQILWVMRGETDVVSMPYYGMVLGFARAFRQENPHIPFTTLSVGFSASAHDISSAIHRISDTASPDPETDLRETDYVLKDTILHVQRILEVESLDSHIHLKTSPQERHLPLSAAGPISLTIGTPGLLDTLHCIPDPVYATPLQSGEIDVEVKAAGLNFRDVMAALGKIGTDELGCECAGIVHRVGPNSPFNIGDRVMAIKFGWFRTYARCEERFVVRLGEECSFEDAAALPIIALTAYYAIVQMGRLEKSESVLIHAGAGATGQMCVQLAQLVGSERVFVTVGSDAKTKFVMEEYGIPPEHIFNSRDTSFAQGILRATDGVGVDMVVNSLSGEGLTASLEVMAPFGRFVELGKADIRGQTKMSMEVFAKGMSFIPVAIDYLSEKRPALVREMLLEVMAMVNDGRLHAARPVKAYPLSQAEAAVRHLQSGTSIGKVVLTISPEDVVPVRGVEAPSYNFVPDATYVIAGGLGGLGRSTARWLVSRGARNLILLSRSGPVSPAARALLEDLQSMEVHVEAPQCDIASASGLQKALDECSGDMPPIRGCIQSTMVLQDALLEKMTFSSWQTAVQAKVNTSWNLHTILPHGMDFFILLSSLSGALGIVGQSNYAAGNTFQDALAKHRSSQGEYSVALDLGLMESIGFVAENAGIGRQATRDFLHIEEHEYHALLDYYCNPDQRLKSGDSGSQVLVGLPTPGHFKSKGREVPVYLNLPELLAVKRLDAHESVSPTSQSQSNDSARAFKAAKTHEEAAAVVLTGLMAKLSRSLSVGIEEIDAENTLHQYGVDSLVAVELRNWFIKEFGANLAIVDFIGAVSIMEVAGRVAAAGKAN